jgi:hypothetical protein
MAFQFLADREDERSWTVAGEEKGRYWVGEGQFALQVTLATFPKEPSRKRVRDLWQERWNKQPSPVLLVAAWPAAAPERAMLCGPLGDDPSIVVRDIAQAERIARRALLEPSRAFAIQFITAALAEIDDELPGIRNEGLLSSHELQVGVPARKDWADASDRAQPMLGLTDRALVEGMGYSIDRVGDLALLRTTAAGEKRAVAVFLDRSERPDAPSAKFDHRTPVDAALLQARREGLRWVLAVRGSTLRLYSASTSGAAGQRGRTETFLELDLALLETRHAGYLSLLFASDALAEGGTFDEVAAASRDFTTKLSERLRDQVYEHTVPRLAAAIAARHKGTPDKAALDGIYHAALTVLFRLLFVAYAEDRRLLPYDTSDAYRAASLKAIAHELSAAKNEGRALGFDDPFTGVGTGGAEHDGASDLWARCRSLFDAVEKGHKRWGIPAYGGGLFTKDSDEGRVLAGLDLSDAEFGPALMALIVDRTPDGGYGPIDFRSLSVREFGSIYEGLLENELAVAEQDLALKRDNQVKADVYVPAGNDDAVVVAQGSVYLHNASGARKSTGSYFTPAFAVDHLIATTLVPRLQNHLDAVEGLLDAGDEAGAAERLLDFRVADIAMGSGHFLTAATDAIEGSVSDLLARRNIPLFRLQLEALRSSARSALGEAADRYELEDSQVLRRLIARKCIYGVDLNPISVELARVSLWIHTFVPGLPLSFLDRTLVVGNSLTGVGSVSEAVEAVTKRGSPGGLFDESIKVALKAVEEPLARLRAVSDATTKEVEESRRASADARAAVEPIEAVFDAIVADRLGVFDLPVEELQAGVLSDATAQAARDASRSVGALHFPTRFPEVFLRDEPGFDVILGNPPWDKIETDVQVHLLAHLPGLRGLPQAEREALTAHLRDERPEIFEAVERAREVTDATRAIILKGPYPGVGRDHPDYAKAFAWRVVDLTAPAGSVGQILPRIMLSGRAMAEWRERLFDSGWDVNFLLVGNAGGYVFSDVHAQKEFLFLAVNKAGPEQVTCGGPVRTRLEWDRSRMIRAAVRREVLGEDGELPSVPDERGWRILSQAYEAPSFAASSFFMQSVFETNATLDKHHFSFSGAPDGVTSLAVYKGASIRHREPDTGEHYAIVDATVARTVLRDKYLAGRGRTNSAYRLWDGPDELPFDFPRLAYRWTTNSTNSRTMVCSLVPAGRVLTNGMYYLLNPSKSAQSPLIVLGVWSSRVYDWLVRRYVETTMRSGIVNHLPFPALGGDSGHAIAQLAAAVTPDLDGIGDWIRETTGITSTGSAVGDPDADAQIDALVADAYRLEPDLLEHVYRTFHPTWSDWAEHFENVQSHRTGESES